MSKTNPKPLTKRSGSTVVFYKWSRCESLKMTGARPDDIVRFFLADMQGRCVRVCVCVHVCVFVCVYVFVCVCVSVYVPLTCNRSILPGCSKDFTFTFVSHASGTYVEDWEVIALGAE